jgi:hypothetical protein
MLTKYFKKYSFMFTCSHLCLQAHEITSLHGLDSKRPTCSCLESQAHEIRSLHGTKRSESPSLSILSAFYKERVLLMLQRMHTTSFFGCFLQEEGVSGIATDACYIYFLGAFYKERVLVALQWMQCYISIY